MRAIRRFRGCVRSDQSRDVGPALFLRVRGNPSRRARCCWGASQAIEPADSIMTLRTLEGVQTYTLRSAFW